MVPERTAGKTLKEEKPDEFPFNRQSTNVGRKKTQQSSFLGKMTKLVVVVVIGQMKGFSKQSHATKNLLLKGVKGVYLYVSPPKWFPSRKTD